MQWQLLALTAVLCFDLRSEERARWEERLQDVLIVEKYPVPIKKCVPPP